MECDYCGCWHETISEATACMEAFDAYEEAAIRAEEQAWSNVYERNEVQAWETEQEEGMIAALWN